MDATIGLAIAEANQSYINSGINIRLSLVDSFQFTIATPARHSKRFSLPLAATPMSISRRDNSGAALGALIINHPESCGLAKGIMPGRANAFAVVHYGCATGYYSFAHELGHLMGARHDEKHDKSTAPFAYGHGFEHPSATPSMAFRTVMAYACGAPDKCDPRVPYWSGPNVHYNGRPAGTELNYNARVLNETAPTIADYANQRVASASTKPSASQTAHADQPVQGAGAARPAQSANADRPVQSPSADRPAQIPNTERPLQSANADRPAARQADDAQPLVGEWLLSSNEILRIGKDGTWFHPAHGMAKIRKADDAADIKVFYENGATHCSYRVTFSDGGKTLDLIPVDATQDRDYCPEGSLKKITG